MALAERFVALTEVAEFEMSQVPIVGVHPMYWKTVLSKSIGIMNDDIEGVANVFLRVSVTSTLLLTATLEAGLTAVES